jgi:hypothetical protein
MRPLSRGGGGKLRDDFGWRRNAVDYVGMAEQELDFIIEEDGESDGSEISDDDGFVGR